MRKFMNFERDLRTAFRQPQVTVASTRRAIGND